MGQAGYVSMLVRKVRESKGRSFGNLKKKLARLAREK